MPKIPLPNKNRFPAPGEKPPPLQKGPFFIVLLMLPGFFVLILLILLAMQYKQLHSFVSPEPMAMTEIPHSAEAQKKVLTELHDFFSAQSPDTLALSAEDVNHLVRTSAALEGLHLDYHISIEDTFLVARNSVPVERLQGPLATIARLVRVHGYLNSIMKGKPELSASKVSLKPISATMNGVPAPASVLDSKGDVNMRDWVADKDFYDHAVAELSAVKIANGRLLLIKRPR